MRKSSPERLLEWSEKIKEQKLSNKSEVVWCQEQGIPYPNFQYWKKKVNPSDPQRSKRNDFLEIPETDPVIEISLRGIKLAISKDFDRSGLVYFLSLLKSE